MNIEEAIDILTQKEVIDLSNHFNNTRFFEAIYIVLTAYEKEKEKNKDAREYIYDLLNNDDIINIGIDDIKIILDMLEE